MKKRKILVTVLILLTIFILWILEPVSMNPYGKIEIPQAQSEINFNGKAPGLTMRMDFEKKANELLNDHMNSGHFLGVSVGVSKLDFGSYVASAGFMDKWERKRANNDMLTRITSITKPMTAIAMMQLYERGLIDLDVPIQMYLKDFPKKSNGDITIRQLLKHTSGMPHYDSGWDAMSFTHYPTLKDAVGYFEGRDLIFDPGTKFQYSSYGYTLLGAILEEVTQMDYAVYMKRHIWDVAGMTKTGVEIGTMEYENKTKGYLKIGSRFVKSPNTDLSIIQSAGGVQSTARGLLKFGEAVLGHRLIKSSTLDMMVNATDQLAPAIGDDPYGFGWAVYDDPKYGRIIQHGGAQPGTSTFFALFFDHQVISVVLSNSFGTRQDAFALTMVLPIWRWKINEESKSVVNNFLESIKLYI
ncbi:serine hydrolase domain-containing protein [Flagellimonas lutimaris]|nr:serine hydrolase domain-containing protein [Allomuricauda lutimaris]